MLNIKNTNSADARETQSRVFDFVSIIDDVSSPLFKPEAQVGQKSLTWIRLLMI